MAESNRYAEWCEKNRETLMGKRKDKYEEDYFKKKIEESKEKVKALKGRKGSFLVEIKAFKDHIKKQNVSTSKSKQALEGYNAKVKELNDEIDRLKQNMKIYRGASK